MDSLYHDAELFGVQWMQLGPDPTTNQTQRRLGSRLIRQVRDKTVQKFEPISLTARIASGLPA